MVKNKGVFSKEYTPEKSTGTSSGSVDEEAERKAEEETQYNIAKPKRRYIKGIISKDED